MKKVGIALLAMIAIFALGEFSLNWMFEEDVPAWKIAAVSIISALSALYPMLKASKAYGLSELVAYQQLQFPYAGTLSEVQEILARSGMPTQQKGQTLKHLAKPGWKSFGRVITLEVEDGQMQIRSKPIIPIAIFDNGLSYEGLQRIKRLICNT